MKKFHDALKTIYGPKSSGATSLLSADGSTLLTNKDVILERADDSKVCSIAHHMSMTMLLTDCHRKSAMFCLMNFQRHRNKESNSTSVFW